MYDIITIGSVTRDVFLKTSDFKIVSDKKFRTGKAGCFVLGAKFEIPEVVFTSGGGGTNTAVTFARQGFKTACIGRVGNDEIGNGVAHELQAEGIESFFQKDEKLNTAYSTILVAMDGERTILEYRGSNDNLNEHEIEWGKLGVKEGGWLYIDSLARNTGLLEALLDWAEKKKIKTAFNPGKQMINLGEKLLPFLNRVDVFLANEDECSLITGVEYSEEKEPEIFAKLDETVKGIVVMSKGPRGVEASDGEKHYVAGIPESPIVERTGAGDSFGSGFVSGYIRSGGNIIQAIQYGTANATSVVQYFGAKKGILRKGDWGEYEKVNVQII